jgi:hypothetical protein
MGLKTILNELSDDKRITICNNDLEFIQFVNLIQTENEDELTYDVGKCVDYIHNYFDNLKFVSNDYDGSKDFEFYADQKHTIWCRNYFTVKAKSNEEATEKVSQMFRDDVLPTDDRDILYETIGKITLEDNGGSSTMVVYHKDGDLLFENGV